MKKTIYLLATILIITFTSCEDEKVSDTAQVKFGMEQKTTTLKSAPAGAFTFTKANIGISEIEFEIEYESEVEEDDFDVEYEGPFQFDILTGTSIPEVTPVDLAPGSYHEIEFEIENVLPSGNSIEISGTFDNGTSYSFEFTSMYEEELEFENTTGIDVSIGYTTNFVLQLDLSYLFMDIDFSTAVMDNDNIIRINSMSNERLATIIEDRFDDIIEFEEDEDEEEDDNDD